MKLRPWPYSNFTVSLNNNVHAQYRMKNLEQRIFKSMETKSSDVCALSTVPSCSAGALSFMVLTSCPQSAHLVLPFFEISVGNFKIKDFLTFSLKLGPPFKFKEFKISKFGKNSV